MWRAESNGISLSPGYLSNNKINDKLNFELKVSMTWINYRLSFFWWKRATFLAADQKKICCEWIKRNFMVRIPGTKTNFTFFFVLCKCKRMQHQRECSEIHGIDLFEDYSCLNRMLFFFRFETSHTNTPIETYWSNRMPV